MYYRKYIVILLLLCIFNGFLLSNLKKDDDSDKFIDMQSMEIRAMNMETTFDKTTAAMVNEIIGDNKTDKRTVKYLEKYVDAVIKDFKVFPVAYSDKNPFVSYDNSWNFSRSYGGNRVHEGTDIMGKINKRGYYPLVACCDGTIEQIGWLELGGYRLGIRSEHGVYAYYAHMYAYEEGIKEGTKVKRGQLLGYMGDSGYSKVEGTVGNFDVHLHFGIYINDSEYGELSINPFYFLKRIEDTKIVYDY